MAAIGTKLRRSAWAGGANLMHWCPGCEEVHGIRVESTSNDVPMWHFDGNYEKPTFAPSILVFVDDDEDDNGNPLPAPRRVTLCHYFIRNGMIDFCGDSPHALSGQTVELPDWPYAKGQYGGIED